MSVKVHLMDDRNGFLLFCSINNLVTSRGMARSVKSLLCRISQLLKLMLTRKIASGFLFELGP